MYSAAYNEWLTGRLPRLDEISAAHSAVGGPSRGRRFTTLQINHSYAVMLTSQFQGFCRDLHDECIVNFVTAISPSSLRITIQQLLSQNRKLDSGNPNPGNIGSDFNRFGIRFWPAVEAVSGRAKSRQTHLIRLTDWRNAIAHQDFDPIKLHGISGLNLQHVTQWRRACEGFARTFDSVMGDYLNAVVGHVPW